MTSEHAYHWCKFSSYPALGWQLAKAWAVSNWIRDATSAHEAFKIAQDGKAWRNPNWDNVKAVYMKEILMCKVQQHPYVKQKLLETGDRELVENSWRDDVWGWGPDKNGLNLLGKLWMEIRSELRSKQ